MKNVISYSLFGSNPLYLVGAISNTQRAKKIYPGWVCRFYVDSSVPENILDSLRTDGAEVIVKNVGAGMSGMMWRFEVASDPEVNYFIVRDVDDRLTCRERSAVDEWIASGKNFHVMRDHPNHRYPMMGGMWGGVSGTIPELNSMLDTYRASHDMGFWSDMGFLNDCLWENFVKPNHISHDEYWRPTGVERKFSMPLEGIGTFVGNKYDERGFPVYDTFNGLTTGASFFLCHNMGLGDHIVCNGLTRVKASGCCNLYVFSKHHNTDSVMFMFRDVPNIHVIGVDGDSDVQAMIAPHSPNSKIMTGVYRDDFRTIPGKSFDEVMYLQAGISFNSRWDTFSIQRDRVEEDRVFSQLCPQQPYIFVHDDPSRGYSIDSAPFAGKTIVKPVIALTSVFGYLKVIEAAEEVHCIDSSFMLMIDSFDMAKHKLFFHSSSRYSDPFVTPKLRNKWEII